MRWIVIFLSNILLIFCFPLEDENLCKRKPYLIFCQEQNVGFFQSRQQNPEVKNSRQTFKSSESPDSSPLERPLISVKEKEMAVEDGDIDVDESGSSKKKQQRPIDLSRPNAEDVAREMGELQRDDPSSTTTTTESNEISETTPAKIQPKHNLFISRYKRAFFSPHSDISQAPAPPAPKPSRNNNNKRQRDWVYLDDSEDLDYIEYRKRRARLLRRLNNLDADQQLHSYHRSTSHYPRSPYSSYGSSYSSYYPSNYYPTYYPSYGYPSSDYGPNPGYMGGYGYRQPFTFGIGSGLNIGLPYGYGVGVGSGLGVTVG
uniref:Uncharacterized protein n=1 Tax=Panagrolaimus sp. PS1159 TaxID=55785 RepID=A0AC35GVC2_9BILA